MIPQIPTTLSSPNASDALSDPRSDPQSDPQTEQQVDRRVDRADDRLIGQQIDHYRIEQRLGGGSMASVYRAIDTHTQQQVAIKILLPGADAALRERFQRETQTASSLHHPNIVPTLTVSPVQNGESTPPALTPSAYIISAYIISAYIISAYIIMEMVEGESLSALLERIGQLSMIDSCVLLAPIAQALEYAHKQGVVHRDVKPSNILLKRAKSGDEGAVRLAALDYPVIPLLSDFGIALILDAPELTSEGRTIGTPAYMAPEQCAGSREIDGRADLYALGAVLYRCLIGRPLFLGSTTQILHAHVYEPVTIPDDHLRLLSPLVVEILQRALAKEPQDRYADAMLLADDLAVAAGQKARSFQRKSNHTGDITATMATLPTMPTPSTSRTLHVLVPALPKPGTPRPGSQGAGRPEENDEPPIPHIPVQEPNRRSRSSGTRSVPAVRRAVTSAQAKGRVGSWIAVGLSALVVTLGVWLIFFIWPRSINSSTSNPPTSQVTEAATQTTETQAEATIPASPSTAPSLSLSQTVESNTSLPTTLQSPRNPQSNTVGYVSPTSISTTISASNPLTSVALTGTLSTTTGISGIVTSDRLTQTSSQELLPTGDPDNFFAEAEEAYQLRDWETVVENLTYLRRFKDNLNGRGEAVSTMLAESYWMLAALSNGKGHYTDTFKLLDNLAKNFIPADPLLSPLSELSRTVRSVLSAENESARQRSLEQLQVMHLDEAKRLVAAERMCDALEQIKAAYALKPEARIQQMREEYQTGCKQASPSEAAKATEPQQTEPPQTEQATSEPPLATASPPTPSLVPTAMPARGRFVYSAQDAETGLANIYLLPITSDPNPQLLVSQAVLPRVDPTEQFLVYYSKNPSAQGLYRIDLRSHPDPDERGIGVATNFTEDGRDYPVSFNWSGDQMVFASEREVDRRSRLYVSSIFGQAEGNAPIVFGANPAWRPVNPQNATDWLVYTGVNQFNSEQGLWLATMDGQNPLKITPEMGDIRPIWAKDGRSIFLMNQTRSGNWDLYRVRINEQSVDQSPNRLIGLPEQVINWASDEGWPTLSPDGRTLAFLSNHNGVWQVWAMPIAEQGSTNTPTLLFSLPGSLPDWLQHSMQWIN